MAVNQTSSRWKLMLAACASVFALACGDDSGDKKTETPPTGAVLGSGIVGKACTADTDCGKGSCKTKQSIGAAGDLLGGFLMADLSLPAPGGYCSIGCTTNANCGEGGVCLGAVQLLNIEGECRKGCSAATDCRDGYECAKPQTSPDGGVVGNLIGQLPAQCQALPTIVTLGPNQTGAACDDAADAGAALMNACKPGVCAVGACTAACLNDTSCGAGAVCVPNGVYGTSGACAESCNVDADCNQYTADGAVGCVETNGRKLCTVKQFPLETGILGKACTATADCGKGQCAMTLGGTLLNPTAAPGGYCTAGCQDDSVCTGGVCVKGNISICYDSCAADSECRTGYSCQTLTGATSKVCAPGAGGGGGASDAGTTPRVDAGSDAGV